MKQRLKIDKRKSIITVIILSVFGFFAYNGPLENNNQLQHIEVIENEYFAPQLVTDIVRERTKHSGMISSEKSYVLGEYGMVNARKEQTYKEAGLLSFTSDMGESLHNEKWAEDIAKQLEAKYGEDADVVVKMKGDLCYAEIYQRNKLQSLYFENRLNNTVMGFSGPIYLGIEMSLSGVMEEVFYLTSKETESYLRKVLRSTYLDQYKGLAIHSDPYTIDAISGATITTRAMAESVTEAFEVTAPQILDTYYDFDLGEFKVDAKLTYWWIAHIAFIFAVFLYAMLPQIKKTKKSRLVVSLLTLAYIGFGLNSSFTYITYLMPFMGTEISLFLAIYALLTLLGAIWGKNAYCSYVCPFGAAQMVSLKYSPFKSKKLFITNKQAEYIRYALTVFLFGGFVMGYKTFGNYELFPDLFSTEISSYWFYVAILFVVISLKYPMLWCRVACPTGCVLDAVKDVSEKRFSKSATVPKKRQPIKRSA